MRKELTRLRLMKPKLLKEFLVLVSHVELKQPLLLILLLERVLNIVPHHSFHLDPNRSGYMPMTLMLLM